MFLQMALQNPIYFISAVIIVVMSITVHEFSHALMALSQGDDTAKKRGHLTLNPLVHMGLQSIVMLLLFGVAWGETPVNPARFRHRFSAVLVSFAGPLANLLLMTLAVVIADRPGMPESWRSILTLAAVLNAFLFLFNMLPVPPLDGFGVLETFIPAFRRLASGLSQYGFLILMLLFFFFGLGGALFDAARLMVQEVAGIIGML